MAPTGKNKARTKNMLDTTITPKMLSEFESLKECPAGINIQEECNQLACAYKQIDPHELCALVAIGISILIVLCAFLCNDSLKTNTEHKESDLIDKIVGWTCAEYRDYFSFCPKDETRAEWLVRSFLRAMSFSD